MCTTLSVSSLLSFVCLLTRLEGSVGKVCQGPYAQYENQGGRPSNAFILTAFLLVISVACLEVVFCIHRRRGDAGKAIQGGRAPSKWFATADEERSSRHKFTGRDLLLKSPPLLVHHTLAVGSHPPVGCSTRAQSTHARPYFWRRGCGMEG